MSIMSQGGSSSRCLPRIEGAVLNARSRSHLHQKPHAVAVYFKGLLTLRKQNNLSEPLTPSWQLCSEFSHGMEHMTACSSAFQLTS